MDKLEQYRHFIRTLLTEYVATPISNGEIESQTVFDLRQDHYQVMNGGWDGHRQFGHTVTVRSLPDPNE